MTDKTFPQRLITEHLLSDDPAKNYKRIIRAHHLLSPLGAKFTTSGLDNIDSSRPTIVTANHPLGPTDVIVLGRTYFDQTGEMLPIVYKQEFAKNPFIMEIFDKLGGLAINQEVSTPAQVKAILALLREGRSVGIFAYKELTPIEQVPPPQEGPLLFASLAGVDIQPVGIYGLQPHQRDDKANPSQKRSSLRKSILQPVHVHIGQPQDTSGLSRKDKDSWALSMQRLHEGLIEAHGTSKKHWNQTNQ